MDIIRPNMSVREGIGMSSLLVALNKIASETNKICPSTFLMIPFSWLYSLIACAMTG